MNRLLKQVLTYTIVTAFVFTIISMNVIGFVFAEGDPENYVVGEIQDGKVIKKVFSNGKVVQYQKISDTSGNLTKNNIGGFLDPSDLFGSSITGIGDFDGDGVLDMMVGAEGDDDGGQQTGAVYLIYLKSDGTVKSFQKISSTKGGFTGNLHDFASSFGSSVTNIGDLNGDGVKDIAVGAFQDDETGIEKGAVWIIFLNNDGTVKAHSKIPFTGGTYESRDWFGRAVTNLGDLDGDRINDLAVGVERHNDGGSGAGAIYILFMNTDGSVKLKQKISDSEGNFDVYLDGGFNFGSAITSLGDIDGDGITDIAVGASGETNNGSPTGAVYILFLEKNGTVKSYEKISGQTEPFKFLLKGDDNFGHSLTNIGDLDGDGINEMVVGARRDDDGGFQRGAIWIIFLNKDGTVKSYQKISSLFGNFTGKISDLDQFGWAVANIGDLNDDGLPELAVSSYFDNDGNSNTGAVWILFLHEIQQLELSDIVSEPSFPDVKGDTTSQPTEIGNKINFNIEKTHYFCDETIRITGSVEGLKQKASQVAVMYNPDGTQRGSSSGPTLDNGEIFTTFPAYCDPEGEYTIRVIVSGLKGEFEVKGEIRVLISGQAPKQERMIYLDKKIYNYSDPFHFSGNLFDENYPVVVTVLSPSGKNMILDKFLPSLNGSFSRSYEIKDDIWKENGEFFIIAESEKQIAKTSLLVNSTKNETDSSSKKSDESSVICSKGTIEKNGKCVPEPANDGGCLIATASFGSELAPQVQMLRETRDSIVMKTQSGAAFMTSFNSVYYSFAPTVADWEKQNPAFKEIVKATITPLITTLSILNYLNIDSETEMLSYGIGVILLNVGMYFAAPTFVIFRINHKLRKGRKKSR